MYIRKVSFNGIKGINKRIELDFTPTQSRDFESNIEFFGLEKNKYEFAALKQIGFMGLNASGKTSVLNGIALGITLLTDPDQNYQVLETIKNKFSTEPIEFTIELVHNEYITKNVEKYEIYYKYESGQFLEEKMTKTTASKNSVADQKILYHFSNNKLKVMDKDVIANHNPLYSIFSLARRGALNEKVFIDKFSGMAIFKTLSIFVDGLSSGNPFFNTLTVPRLASHRKLLVKLLQTFDDKIKDIEVDSATGKMKILIESEGKIISEGQDNVATYLSEGTINAWKNFSTLLNSLFTNSIIFYDEFGEDIHSGLFRTYLETFKSSKAQLIFATHNESIFRQSIRHDQLFFISNVKGVILARRFSDFFDTRDENITSKKVLQVFDAAPKGILDLMELIDEIRERNE